MTFKMAFSREEVINQEERTPGEQLITLNNAGQGELGSGTLSQWSVDKMGGGALRDKGNVAEQQEPGRTVGFFGLEKRSPGETRSYF